MMHLFNSFSDPFQANRMVFMGLEAPEGSRGKGAPKSPDSPVKFEKEMKASIGKAKEEASRYLSKSPEKKEYNAKDIAQMTMEQKRNEFTKVYGNLNEINFKGNKTAESMIGLKDLFDAPMVRIMKSGMGKEGVVTAEKGADGNYYLENGKKAAIYSGDTVAPLSQEYVEKVRAKQSGADIPLVDLIDDAEDIPLADLIKDIPLVPLTDDKGDKIASKNRPPRPER